MQLVPTPLLYYVQQSFRSKTSEDGPMPSMYWSTVRTGSQISAMTSDCLARLGLSKRRFQSEIVGLAQSPMNKGSWCYQVSIFVTFWFRICVSNNRFSNFIANYISHVSGVRHRYQYLLLADKDFDIPARINVFFGADIFPNLLRPSAGVEQYSGFPSALDTQLGWIVFGSFSTSNTSPLVTLTVAVDQSINNQLQSCNRQSKNPPHLYCQPLRNSSAKNIFKNPHLVIRPVDIVSLFHFVIY